VSTILRWWTRHGNPTAPRTLGALLLVIVLTATGLATLPARPPGQVRAAWMAGHSPPPAEPGPARAAPEPKGAIPAPSPPPVWHEPAGDFTGWAVVDLAGGEGRTVTASDNATELSTTASMIKAWIAADYLRRVTETGGEPSPGRLLELTEVIRDSNNAYTEVIFQELGAHESIERLIDICGLPYARAVPQQWSGTLLSPVDTALMGVCIADGRAAGPEWTDWLLEEMRLVRGLGDFGIRDAVPLEQRSSIAIKNGWVARKSQQAWHVNCLAIGQTWTMGVMTRYPEQLGYEHGAEICRSLAAEHLPILAPAPAAPPGPDQPYAGPQPS
jgi:hypothetical protein